MTSIHPFCARNEKVYFISLKIHFEFCGNLDSVYRQIGNAVPVRLAEFVARQVRPYLEQAA